MRTTLATLALVWPIAFLALAAAEEPSPRAVIEALAQRNPQPKLVDGDPLFDPKFDWDEYSRVWKQLRKLTFDVERLRPELVQHLSDERYCMTAMNFVGYTNTLTVGDVSRELLAHAVTEAHMSVMKIEKKEPHLRMRYPEFTRDRKEFQAWLERRQDKALYELQIESCQWALETVTLRKNPPGTPEQRKAWKTALEAEIRRLETSRTAVNPRWFQGEGWESYDAKEAEDVRKRHAQPAK